MRADAKPAAAFHLACQLIHARFKVAEHRRFCSHIRVCINRQHSRPHATWVPSARCLDDEISIRLSRLRAVLRRYLEAVWGNGPAPVIHFNHQRDYQKGSISVQTNGRLYGHGESEPAGRQLSAQFWRVFSTRQTEDFEVAKRLFVLASASGSLVQSTMNLSAHSSLIFYIYYNINSTKSQISNCLFQLIG